MRVKVIAASSKKDFNGNQLSIAQLEDLAQTAIGKNIGVEFNPFIPPIGKIVGAEVKDNQLLIEAEVPDDFEGYFIAPSYSIDKNTRIVASLDYALTKGHSDPDASESINLTQSENRK